MAQSGVAVLDIRSSEVVMMVGERGVNNTFIFKASAAEPYEGYQNGSFFDLRGFKDAVFRALASVERICGEHIRSLYVGVPGEFLTSVAKEQTVGFPKKRKIGKRELDSLFERGREEVKGYRFIRASSAVFVTADNRRVVDPEGIVTTGLSGVLSYFYCSDSFVSTLENVFAERKMALRYLPTPLAMATYLIPPETRDEFALLLDMGYLSSTVCLVLGGSVLAEETCWAGKGQVAATLMQRFPALTYDAAVALLGRINVYSRTEKQVTEFIYRGTSYTFPPEELADAVKDGLDGLCEPVGGFLEQCTGKEIDVKPLYITGEGTDIRSCAEHLSKRFNRVIEPIAPALPYYNKPAMSSRVALMDMACEDHRKRGVIYRLFNRFGG